MKIFLTKLSDNAKTPTRSHNADAGYDLYSAEDGDIKPLERKLFKIDTAIAIPDGHYGRIADRSGNALKIGIHVLGGVVDAHYRGNVGVILFNTNKDSTVSISKGERIAQLIIEKCFNIEFEETKNLEQSVRGSQGFGSSGK